MSECMIEIRVTKMPDNDDPEKCPVRVEIGINDDDPPDFATLMCAAEYLAAVVACESNAGYEKALELVVQGAMTYKHMMRPKR